MPENILKRMGFFPTAATNAMHGVDLQPIARYISQTTLTNLSYPILFFGLRSYLWNG